MNCGKLSMNGQARNNAPWSTALSDHIRLGPNRSTSFPAGTAARKLAIAATVSPIPDLSPATAPG
jgi:hypothetical protein